MIWVNTLGKLEYYLIGAFMLSYILYLIRIIIITLKNIQADPGNILKKIVLRSAYFTLLIISLLGPSFGDVKKEVKSIGKDIFILVDVSASMGCQDILPSRLERGKKELATILKNLRFNDRIGLIAYAGSASLQCPLTYDTEAVLLYLNSLKANILPEGGSNMEAALDLALERFKLTDDFEKSSKVVLLISDGESFEGNSKNAIAKFKRNGIVLISLGLGTLQGGKILIGKSVKKDKNGQPVVTKLNRALLTDLAQTSRGTYFEINENTDPVANMAETINGLEVTIKEVRKIGTASNKYYYFLVAALVLMLIDGLTTVNVIRI